MLSVLVPVTVTDAMLVSSTAPETDYLAWSAATTYALGARCISTTTHRIYESLAAGNLDHDPTNVLNQTGTAPWWLDVGPTNRWAMFDGVVSTQTSIASPLTVVLQPGNFNALYLAGIDAGTLAITIKDAPGGSVIYSYTGSLDDSAPDDYYGYFFDRFKPKTDFLAANLEPYNGCEITLTLSRLSAVPVKCGVLAIGDLRPLGETQYGAKAKPKTYSYIKTDAFGNNVIVRRKSAQDMTATAWLELAEANRVLVTIRELLDVPCVWIGSDLPDYAGLRVYGLGSGELSFDYPKDCLLTLNVSGLI